MADLSAYVIAGAVSAHDRPRKFVTESRTVAEGIEDGEQLDALVALGCEIGQGYLFSRPLAVDQVPRASLEAA